MCGRLATVSIITGWLPSFLASSAHFARLSATAATSSSSSWLFVSNKEEREPWLFGAAHCAAMVVVADEILAQDVSQEASISPLYPPYLCPLYTDMGILPKTRGGMS